MGEQEPGLESKRFGFYLRRLREGRKFSLDAVEEMSTGYPERITKSHLSRIENGLAIPTFPRAFALAQIYGVPVSSMAERFEIEYKRETLPADISGKTDEDVLEEARKLRLSGMHKEAVVLYEGLLERHSRGPRAGANAELMAQLRLHRANCLVQLSRYGTAKEECEDLLNNTALTAKQVVLNLQYLAMCCYKLRKYRVAMWALDEAESGIAEVEDGEALRAYLATLRGRIMVITGDPERAVDAFAESLTSLEAQSNRFEACRARINLADALMACGEGGKARIHLKKALDEAESGKYERLRALALSNLAELAYREGDLERAEAQCLLSNTIARSREFYPVVFRNCYYMWKIAQKRKDVTGIKANEQALRAYLSRVDEYSPEAVAYRKHLTGGDA